MALSEKYQFVTGDVLVKMTERFWERVEKGPGCWKWLGGCRSNYASLYIPLHRDVSVYGHVFSFFLHRGRWPAEGKMVCHTRVCTSRECVNPDHLYEGTAFTNALDYQALRKAA